MIKQFAYMSIVSLALLAGCSRHYIDYAAVDTTNLAELEALRVDPRPSAEYGDDQGFGSIKLKALTDSGMSMGAQGGLAWAAEKMNAKLRQDKSYLDTIFNFDAMVLSHGVIPPVLAEGDFSLNQDDPNTIRVADRTYKIIQQARFATTPPNWREYLWLNFSKPPLIDKSLLPRNAKEVAVWRAAVRRGWESGIAQASSIFQQNLARLKRDYNGMVLYRKLLQEKMISTPFVARTELGITGDGNDMRINDQVLRIVELPQLQTNGSHWRPIVVKRNG